MNAILYN